jgi:hypothetical protein
MADEDFGHSSPFAKVSVLVGIMKKAGSAGLIEWVVLSIDDLWRNNMLGIGEVSWDQLTGYRAPGHKGTVDLLVYKHEMLVHLLDVFAAKHPFEATCVAKLRDIFMSHANYRAKVEPSQETKNAAGFIHPDISYRALWKKSGRLLAALVEETVFTREHDGCLKIAVKARKVPDETLQYERFQDRTNEILTALTEEKKESVAAEQLAAEEAVVAMAGGGDTAKCIGSSDGSTPTITVDVAAETWHKVAERNFITHCFLIPEPSSGTALVTAIQSTPIGTMRGKVGSDYIMVHFDQKLSGESASKPAFRYPPLADDRFTKLMKSAIKARSGDENTLLDFCLQTWCVWTG